MSEHLDVDKMRVELIWLWLVTVVCAAQTLKGTLEGSVDDKTKLVLTDVDSLKSVESYLKPDGSFTFPGLKEGVYSLEVEAISHLFDSVYRVEVTDDELKINKVFHGHDFNKDLGPNMKHPLSIVPFKQAQYIFEREEFSVINMLKSPMMLMSLVSLVLVFVLPKLTASMDPETIKQMQEQQRSQPNPMEKVQNFDMASYMAGKSTATKQPQTKPSKKKK